MSLRQPRDNSLHRAGFVDRRWLALIAAIVVIALIAPIVQTMLEAMFWKEDLSGELPDELVLARVPDVLNWNWQPDPLHGGFLLVMHDPDRGVASIERLQQPWAERTTERTLEVPTSRLVGLPGSYFLMMPLSLSHDGRTVCIPHMHEQALGVSNQLEVGGRLELWNREVPEQSGPLPGIGQVSAFSHDERLLAESSYGEQARTKVVSLESGKVLAMSDVLAAGSGDPLAWHPTSNVLVIGGYDHVTLLSEPDWQPRRLATVERDQAVWLAGARAGTEPSGFHPNENVNRLRFSPDGSLLICSMDLGLRVYDWSAVVAATGRLPAPSYSRDGELVELPWGIRMKLTYDAIYDSERKLILWGGFEGKLKFLNLETHEEGTLLKLPNRCCIFRMELSPDGSALGCYVQCFRDNTAPSPIGLVVLDYPRLVAGH